MRVALGERRGRVTYAEIVGQCGLWPDTVRRVSAVIAQGEVAMRRPVLAGAGTSAYAASAIAAGWSGAEAVGLAQAVATTDLMVAPELCGEDRDGLISIARSGSSPESAGVVRLMQRRRPSLKQVAITCNAEGELARMDGVEAIVLDPRTNDRALAMTGSFTNLVLAGLAMRHGERLSSEIETISARVEGMLGQMDQAAQRIAAEAGDRAVVLGSPALVPLAREAALKITELTGGAVSAMAESFLGLRHGPMAYVRRNTLVVCFLSSDAKVRRYELDLVEELRRKGLGRIVCVGAAEWGEGDEWSAAVAPELPDGLRTPFEAVFAQLLAFHLSLRVGLDPDHPSPDGVIHRVVEGVRLYE
jgi:tagatose-6-phosphate ketose/aldose isomerase